MDFLLLEYDHLQYQLAQHEFVFHSIVIIMKVISNAYLICFMITINRPNKIRDCFNKASETYDTNCQVQLRIAKSLINQVSVRYHFHDRSEERRVGKEC